MAVKLSPIWVGAQFFTSAGLPLSGGKINTYLAGTTTPQSTFTDNTGITPNANPIILDSAGRYSNQIWLTAGINYKFVLTDSNNNIILTEDNISGVNDTTSGVNSEWLPQSTPTYISGTSFSVAGNQTATFQVGRRIQATLNSGLVYSTILTSVFGAVTTVTVANDSTALDNTLSAVSVGLLGESNPSIPAIINYALTLNNATIKNTNFSVGSLNASFFQNQGNTQALASIEASASRLTTGVFTTYGTNDTNQGMTVSTANGTIQVPVAGKYLVIYNVLVQSTGGGAASNCSFGTFKNGSLLAYSGNGPTENVKVTIASDSDAKTFTKIAYLAANDTLDIRLTSIGAGLNQSAINCTFFQVALLY